MNEHRPSGANPDPKNDGPPEWTSEMCRIKMELNPSPVNYSNDTYDTNDNVGIPTEKNLKGREIADRDHNGTEPTCLNLVNKCSRQRKPASSEANKNGDELTVLANENELGTACEKGAEEVQVMKGKRGRKKKVVVEVSSDNPVESIITIDPDGSGDKSLKPGPLKGKRGRRKKGELVVSSGNVEGLSVFATGEKEKLNANLDGDDSVAPQKKRGRGRPVTFLRDSEGSDVDDSLLAAPKQKRKRRRVIPPVVCDDEDYEYNSIELEATKKKKSRGRPSTAVGNADNSGVSCSIPRGRKKKQTTPAYEYSGENSACDQTESQVLFVDVENVNNSPCLIKVEEGTENMESVAPTTHIERKKTPVPLTTVKCASCQKEVSKNEFQKHNIDNHNNLAWFEGSEPVNLSDEKLVNKLLKHALTKGRRKKLICELCGAEKKSVLGFVGHKRFCGKSAEEQENLLVTCELCGRKVKPVSVKAHMSIHERPEKIDIPVISCTEDPSKKRAAATKAKSKMMEFLYDDGTVMNSSPSTSQQKQRLLYSSPNDKKRTPTTAIAQWKADIQAGELATCVNPACSFKAKFLAAIRKHYVTCPFGEKVQGLYSCSLCVFKCEDESTIEEHISAAHPWSSNDVKSGQESGSEVEIKLEEESLSEDQDSDEERKRSNQIRSLYSKTRKLCHKYRFLAIEDPGRSGLLDTYSPTLMWTLKFRLDNDSYALFRDFHCTASDWELIDPAEAKRYLPAATESVYTSFGNSEAGKRFKPFESQVIDDMSVMFVGGPIWCCAWCPIPVHVSILAEMQVSQVLAVSCHREMDEFHLAYPCFVGPNVIQIWDCGLLTNSQTPQEAKLILAIAHEFGTVWRMEWCPSGAYGCYEPGTLVRMGLLAAACSDGCVHIFSVCFPNQLEAHLQNKGPPVYRVEPVLTLRSNSSDMSQCTRLSWYRGKGHGLIAGGFCDGRVTLWNLEKFSTLLFDKDNRELYPYRTFQAHLSVVSALSLSPDGQYLMTGSHDCSVKFWDLDDTNAPITTSRKGMVTDGVWLTHWLAGMASYDDAFLHEHTNATVIPIRDFGYKPLPAIPQNSVGWCLSESPWLNSVVQGTQAGEVGLNIAGQLFTGLDNEKNIVRKRLMVSFTELRELIKDSDGAEALGPAVKPTGMANTGSKSKQDAVAPPTTQEHDSESPSTNVTLQSTLQTPEQPGTSKQSDPNQDEANAMLEDLESENFKDTTVKYGVNIVNILNFKADNVPPEATKPMRQSNFMHPVLSDKYPITSVNQVQWNPHLKSCLWLAIGHHTGLLRLICLRYMHTVSLDRFLNKAEALVEKAEKNNTMPPEHT